jgi:hypothetical protein
MATLIARAAVAVVLIICLLIWRELRHLHRRLDAWAESVRILADTEAPDEHPRGLHSVDDH